MRFLRIPWGRWLVFVLGTVPFLAGCASDCKPEVPQGALFPRTDTPPTGAKLLTAAEFDSQVKSGALVQASLQSIEEQKQRAVEAEAQDDAIIQAFIRAHPELPALSELIPPPAAADDKTVEVLPDGNYRHLIKLGSGTETHVVTMGPAWYKRLVAGAITRFPTRRNQLAIYNKLYRTLPADWRNRLELPDPGRFELQTSTDSTADIGTLIKRVTARYTDIIGSMNLVSPLPAGYVSDCTKEIGAGTGTDRTDSKYDGSDPKCGVKPEGVWSNYNFPMKYYVTCVKNQSWRGTCVSFANTSSIEYWVAKRLSKWVNLSEQSHYNRMKLKWERVDFGDGFFSELGFDKMTAEDWLLPFEEQWNYNPSVGRIDHVEDCKSACTTDACKGNCETNTANRRYTHSCDSYTDTCSDSTHQSEMSCMDLEDGYYCGYSVPEKNPSYYGYRITSGTQIWDPANVELSFALTILHLALDHPLVIGLPVTPSFDDAGNPDLGQHGYVKYLSKKNAQSTKETSRGGHALHVVGFIDNSRLAQLIPAAPPGEGGGYLIVKNSWSNCWGDGGYIYLPYRWVKEYTGDMTVLYGIQTE